MVQGNDSLEVQSETQLDSFDSCSSCYEYVDANTLNEELSIVCEKLIEKYKVLKKKSLGIEKENKSLHSRLNNVLQENVGPMAFHSSFDDDQHSYSYVY